MGVGCHWTGSEAEYFHTVGQSRLVVSAFKINQPPCMLPTSTSLAISIEIRRLYLDFQKKPF